MILSRRLTLTLGGDATFDLARVLRVPGTLNVKAAAVSCHLVRWVPRRRYDPAEVEPYLREIPAGTVPADAGIGFNDVEAPTMDRLHVPGWARRLIARGDVERYPSRSEADMAVVQALLRAKVSPDGIRGQRGYANEDDEHGLAPLVDCGEEQVRHRQCEETNPHRHLQVDDPKCFGSGQYTVN